MYTTTVQPGTEGKFKTKHVVIETIPKMTKIEAKLFLENVYGVKVEKMNSLVRTVRKVRSKQLDTTDIKRFYVELTSEVELPNVPKPLENIVDRPLLKR